MKKLLRNGRPIAALIAIIVTFSALAACGQGGAASANSGGGDGVFINEKYAASGLLTIHKEAVDYQSAVLLKSWGFGLHLTPDMVKLNNEAILLPGMLPPYSLRFTYNSENAQELLFFNIARIPKDYAEGDEILQDLKDHFSHVEPFATRENDTYYFAYNDDFSGVELSKADRTAVDLIASQLATLKNGLCLFPPLEDDDAAGGEKDAPSNVNMNEFNAKTLDGGTFTNEDLAKYDLTMVNVWTTWCSYCVKEMPDLEKLFTGMLPENVNLISICGDANEEPELAKEMMEKLNLTFKALIPDEKLKESLLKEITSFPSTFFVDSKGNVVGKMQLGAPSSGGDVAEGYLKIIQERLNMEASGQ
ncbi:MAG: TlpA family protein disulfide reductase [Clostridiales bacterium]|nr:TlpA family protein disulfide reductase [Clostridiales bacterium]